MMRLTLFAGACLLLLAGCNAVYSDKPVGETPVVVTPEEWEGTWAHKEGAVTVAVSDGAKGLLDVGWVEKKQGQLVFEHYRVQLLQSGRWMFGSTEDSKRPAHFVWGSIEKDGEQLILWTPNVARVRELVATGELRGRLLDDDVMVTDAAPGDIEKIMSLAVGAMDWERPLVFNRIAR
jgi:hypothetical protein